MNVPQLRFDGFSGEWKNTFLKNEVEFFDNKRKPVTENLRKKGIYPYYGATGIIDYVEDYVLDGEYLLLAEDGANILTRSAPVVYKTKNKFWVNNHAHVLKPKESNDFNFVYQVLENINYVPYNSGTAQPKLNLENVKKIPLTLPSLNEQQKIGSFFDLLSKKIEKHQEKIEKLEHFKKGMMQKIFSQELRFKDEDGEEFQEWEQVNLGEVVKIETGNKDTINKIEDGTYPFFVRSQTIERINSYSFDGEAILTAGDGVGVGKVFHYIDGRFDYHQRVYKLSDFKHSVGKYIFYYFKENFLKEAMKYNAKTSVDSVRRDMIVKMLLPLPSVSEQRKIADYFSAIDKKIEKEKEKLMVLEEQKRGFMQGMFV